MSFRYPHSPLRCRSWLFSAPLVVFALLCSSPANAVTVTWNAGDGNWGTAGNWNPAQVPNVAGGDDAVIDNGATVTYVPGGDLIINNGGSLAISGPGSTWRQTVTNWTQVWDGSLSVTDGGRFERTAGGNLMLGQSGSNTNAELNVFGPGSTVAIGGELWFGHSGTGQTNQVASINIGDGGSIIANSTVGLWLWDYDAPGNDFKITFERGPGSFIEVSNRFGIRENSGASNNQAQWQTLWDLGILNAWGNSGLTGAELLDFFEVTGSHLADGQSYRITLVVPEPGRAALLAVAALGLMLRRRR